MISDSQRAPREGQPPLRRAPGSAESREAAIERADLAEHREQVHQERWARETDALRARLANAEHDVRELAEARLRVAQLSHALASAQQRISLLEDEVARRAP
jgi:hypothetical protein